MRATLRSDLGVGGSWAVPLLVMVFLLAAGISPGPGGAAAHRGQFQPGAPLVAWMTTWGYPFALNLTDNISGGVPPYHVEWKLGNGITQSNLTFPYVLFGSAGEYRVVLTVNDSVGTAATATSFPIDLPPSSGEPAVQATASGTFGAAPFVVHFLGAPYGGNVSLPVWNFGDGTPLTSGWNASHTYLQAGDYAATLLASAPFGYTARYVITVLVTGSGGDPLVVANVTSNATCAASGAAIVDSTFQTTAAGGTPPYQYVWFFGDGSSGTGANVAHQYSTAGPGGAPWSTPRILAIDSRGFEATSSVPAPTQPCVPPEQGISMGPIGFLGWAAWISLVAVVVFAVWRLTRPPPYSPPPGA